jgi:hypothetical protein
VGSGIVGDERRRCYALEHGIPKLERATTANPFAGRMILQAKIIKKLNEGRQACCAKNMDYNHYKTQNRF